MKLQILQISDQTWNRAPIEFFLGSNLKFSSRTKQQKQAIENLCCKCHCRQNLNPSSNDRSIPGLDFLGSSPGSRPNHGISLVLKFWRLHVKANGKLEKVSLHSRFKTTFAFSFPSELAKQVISKRSKSGDFPHWRFRAHRLLFLLQLMQGSLLCFCNASEMVAMPFPFSECQGSMDCVWHDPVPTSPP